MRKTKLNIFIFFIVASCGVVISQTTFDIGASHIQGININKASDRDFGETNPVGIEFRFNKQRVGKKYWEKYLNYPQTGWSVSWINHRNVFLKHTIALNRYIHCVFLRRKYFNAYLKLAQGVMFAMRIYEKGSDKHENFNNAFGQYVNFSEEIGLGITVYPTKKLAINLGATGIHFSNGSMAQPNDGLNLIMFNAGFSYCYGNAVEFLDPEKTEFDKGIKFNINPGVGFKQQNRNDNVKYQLFTFSLYADKMLTRVNALNIGLDVYVNGAEKQVASSYSVYEGKDYRQIGISAGNELFLGNVGLLTQLGYYVYSPIPSNSNFYQKFGFKYYLNDVFFTTFTAKFYNLEISDEIAWGIGMRL